MGTFRNWLERVEPSVSSSGDVANPTEIGQKNMGAAAKQATKDPHNVKKIQGISQAALQGNNDKARKLTTGFAADVQKNTPQTPTTYKGLVTSIGNMTPGVNVKQLFRDPSMKKTFMHKEGTFVDVPKAAFDLEKKANSTPTVLPKKGDAISYRMMARKKSSPVRPAKSANPTGIKLTKPETHKYKNPFA